VQDPPARPPRHPDALPPDTLPPVDAPLVPGGGPAALLWFDRRATAWLGCALGAAVALPSGSALLIAAAAADSLLLFALAFVLMGGGVALGVVAVRRRHTERHDGVLDDATVYATGTAVDLAISGRDDLGVSGAVRRDGRVVATIRTGAREDLVLEVGSATLRLEERAGRVLGLRAVDPTGREHLRADGHRAGDLVDWVVAVPGGELLLRQHLGTVPSRRTLLDVWGRAWATTDDIDLRRWTAQLPTDLDDAGVAFALVLLVHVDGLGVEHCAGHGPGPEAWSPVRGVAVRAAPPRWTDD